MNESYLATVRRNRVISIPKLLCETLKIGIGDTIRVKVEKVNKE
jgi:bifunctional DNA-binding transcriptional regulator/antitoxin component of YhaV-PrlF toxin-antitoxin module